MSALTGSRKRKSLADRRRQLRLIVAGLVAALVISSLGGAVYALHLPAVTISSVTVSDGNYVDTTVVQGTAAELLKGSYAFIIPRSFSLLYPRSGIVAAIHASFPAIKDVTVVRQSLTALAISVTERTPVARWCSDVCYFIDDAGMIFAPADSVAGVAYGGGFAASSSAPIGQIFLNGGFPALADFIAKLPSATGHTPVSVSVDPADDVAVALDTGGLVKFNRSQDFASLIDSITTTFASKQFKSGTAFEYADFRFGASVYVKWK
jgi:hypothetical protein